MSNQECVVVAVEVDVLKQLSLAHLGGELWQQLARSLLRKSFFMAWEVLFELFPKVQLYVDIYVDSTNTNTIGVEKYIQVRNLYLENSVRQIYYSSLRNKSRG